MTSQPIEIPFSRFRLMLILICSVFSMFFMVWIISHVWPMRAGYVLTLAFWGFILFMGCLTLIISLWRIIAPRPALILDALGIVDNTRVFRANKRIHWQDIRGVKAVNWGGAVKLTIVGKPQKNRFFGKYGVGGGRTYGTEKTSEYILNVVGTPISVKKLARLINDGLTVYKLA